MTRVRLEQLSPEHQAFIEERQRYSDRHRKPGADAEKPQAFDEVFDSKTELQFAHYLEASRKRGEMLEWRYHPLAFWLAPRVTYEPDFISVHLPTQSRFEYIVYEVKGSWKSKNARDSRTRLHIAAHLYPWFGWMAATLAEDGVGWDFEPIPSRNPHLEVNR